MLEIRPVSDLRNKFTEIEKIVKKGNPVYLTKNGYGSMVALNLKQYADLINDIEMKLDEADFAAGNSNIRHTHKEVFIRLKSRVKK
jgi:prevent-host-death family protein